MAVHTVSYVSSVSSRKKRETVSIFKLTKEISDKVVDEIVMIKSLIQFKPFYVVGKYLGKIDNLYWVASTDYGFYEDEGEIPTEVSSLEPMCIKADNIREVVSYDKTKERL